MEILEQIEALIEKGYTHSQIAKELNIPLGTLKTKLFRSKHKPSKCKWCGKKL